MSKKILQESLHQLLSSNLGFTEIADRFEEWFNEVSLDESLEDDYRFELISDLLSDVQTPPGVLDVLVKRFSQWQFWTEDSRLDEFERLIRNSSLSSETISALVENCAGDLGFYDLGNIMRTILGAKNLTDSAKARLLLYQIDGDLLRFQTSPEFFEFTSDSDYLDVILTLIKELVTTAKGDDLDPTQATEMVQNSSLLRCPKVCIRAIADNQEFECRGHTILEVDYELARNQKTPPSVLAKLSQHEIFHIRALTALNPATTATTLEEMFNREESYLFLNSDSDMGTGFCWYLDQHEYYHGHPVVYSALFMNLNTPAEIRLKYLDSISLETLDEYGSQYLHDVQELYDVNSSCISLDGLYDFKLYAEDPDDISIDDDELETVDPLLRLIFERSQTQDS